MLVRFIARDSIIFLLALGLWWLLAFMEENAGRGREVP